MSNTQLEVYILKTPKNSRAAILIDKLSASNRINLNVIDSVMVRNEDDIQANGIELDENTFRVLEGRRLSFGEIGCAHSHNLARKKIADTNRGGVVLEDDARIESIDEFVNIACKFLNEDNEIGKILTLTSFWSSQKKRQSDATFKKRPWIKLMGHAPLAVAYAITPKAAADMYTKNTPIKFVADWPVSSCAFYVLRNPTVNHGDDVTSSLIDSANTNFRQGVSISKKFARYSFYSYLNERNKKIRISEYLSWVYLRRIRWYLDIIIVKIKSVR